MIEVTKKIDITNLLQIYFNSQKTEREDYEAWWANHDDIWNDDYGWSQYDDGTNWWNEYETFKKNDVTPSKSKNLVWDKQSQQFVEVSTLSNKKKKVKVKHKKQNGVYTCWDEYLEESQKLDWSADNSSLFNEIYEDEGIENTRGHKNQN